MGYKFSASSFRVFHFPESSAPDKCQLRKHPFKTVHVPTEVMFCFQKKKNSGGLWKSHLLNWEFNRSLLIFNITQVFSVAKSLVLSSKKWSLNAMLVFDLCVLLLLFFKQRASLLRPTLLIKHGSSNDLQQKTKISSKTSNREFATTNVTKTP